MTRVEFQFITPLGVPILNAPFEVQLSKSSFDDVEDGILMPRLVVGNTGPTGTVILELKPATAPYFVSMTDTGSDAALGYKIVVPYMEIADTVVRMQDLVIDKPISSTTYDEAAIASIHAAKANALAAQQASHDSEVNSKASEISAAESAVIARAAADSVVGDNGLAYIARVGAEAAQAKAEQARDLTITNAGKASASQIGADTSARTALSAQTNAQDAATVSLAARDVTVPAKDTAVAAKDAAIAARDVATGARDTAVASRDTAVASKDTAVTQAGIATTKAGEAAASAAAALSSEGKAKTSEANAKTSETNAAGSATLANTRAADAGWYKDRSYEARDAAGISAANAKTSETNAAGSVTTSFQLRDQANTAATNAATSAKAAADSATAAQTTVTNAINDAVARTKTEIINGAPAALDTLNELAAALQNDPNFATTVSTGLNNRVRVDAAQAFTAGQQAQARTNMGLAAVAASGSKVDVGLGNVDNTSDANKPVSTAQQAALNLKANAAAPAFTGRAVIGTTGNSGSLSLVSSGATLDITPDMASGANGVVYDTSFAQGGAGPHLFKIGGNERLRVALAGIGIGNINPVSYATLGSLAVGNTQGGVLDFMASAVGIGSNRVAQLYGKRSGALGISTGANDNLLERVLIDEVGNVMINKTGLQYALDGNRRNLEINGDTSVMIAGTVGNQPAGYFYSDLNGTELYGSKRLDLSVAGAVSVRLDNAGGLTLQRNTGSFSFAGGGALAQINNYRTGDMELVNRVAGNGMNFYVGAGQFAAKFDGTGKMGLGVTAPRSKLDIDSGANGGITLDHFYSYGATNWALKLDGQDNTSGGYLSQYVVNGGFHLAQGGWYYGGGPWITDAKSTSFASVSGYNGVLIFHTNTGLTANTQFTPTERMRITPDGKVGVGADNPLTKFHVNEASTTSCHMTVGNLNNGLLLGVAGDGTAQMMAYAGQVIQFGAWNAGNPIARAWIDTGGGFFANGSESRLGRASFFDVTAGGQYNPLTVNGDVIYKGRDDQVPVVLAMHNGSGIRASKTMIQFRTNGSVTDAVNIDANGSLGVGTTPQGGHASFRFIEFGKSSLFSNIGDGSIYLSKNAYFDGAWKYKVTSNALSYVQDTNGHVWNYAPNGSAGGAVIGWTQGMTLDMNGNLMIGVNGGGNWNKICKPVGVGAAILEVRSNLINNGGFAVYAADTIGENAASAVVSVSKINSTGRSINTAGFVSTSGNDYAEYMEKAPTAGDIAKGQIVGIDVNGMVTDHWADSVSFMIKSTNPSFVGGDTWGTLAAIGATRPEAPVFVAPAFNEPLPGDGPSPVDGDTEDEGYLAALAAYAEKVTVFELKKAAHEDEVDLARLKFDTITMPAYQAALEDFEAKLEASRQKVDRIAYAGQVPVNVYDAQPGQYIVPVQTNEGGITGVLVNEDDMTLKQYMKAVGIVQNILPDGRANVRVKPV